MIHGHGDDYQGELKANFSSNVWADGDNPALKQHLSEQLHVIDRYPEPYAASLRECIAAKSGLATNELLVTNGSVETFYLIAQAFQGALSLIKTPTFSEYADACRLYSHRMLTNTQHDLFDTIVAQSPNLVWICNPNNPDGYCYSIETLRSYLRAFPQTIFIIDQAYAGFTHAKCFDLNEIHHYPNLLIVESLTKRYAIPGLRLGYVVGNEELIARIAGCQQPWTVNAMAIEAGHFLLDGYIDSFDLAAWITESAWLQAEIDAIPDLEVVASNLPYFLVRLHAGKAADLKQYLVSKQLLIRDASNFDGLQGEWIRICALRREQNSLLLDELKRWSQFITV